MSGSKVTLFQIELENFKTYKGKVVIGPIKTLVAVAGPNGSGKSNLLDALSFALGEKAHKLRVKALPDLIFGAHVGRPVAQKASVSVVFRHEDETLSHFTRSVVKSSQHFYLNKKTVSSAVYLGELEKLGINMKAKNFLVSQGMVEEIAMMDKKDRTALLEEMSGSKIYSREYEELMREMNETGEKTQSAYTLKRNVRSEYNTAKVEESEVKKHEQLKEELADKTIEFQLFQLFYNQKDIEMVEATQFQKQSAMKEIESVKKKAEGKLIQVKKSWGVANRELAKLQKNIDTEEGTVEVLQAPFIKAKAEVGHLRKKLDNNRLSLKQAQEANKKHLESLKMLEEELLKVQEEQREFNAKTADESLSQGIDVELEESQVQDYNEKKKEAARLSAKYQQKIEPLLREHKSYQDCLDNENRKCFDIELKIKQKLQEKEDSMKRCERLSDRICTDEKELGELTERYESASSDCNILKEQMEFMQKELEKITVQLGDANIDQHEESRNKKKKHAVLSLKEQFPGVFDRLFNLCEPVHQKYAIALTKVMGKFAHAIVVDKEMTAKLCIRFLKAKMMEPEIFLPLDFIEVKPLKEYLRKSAKPKNCHLLYDVVKFEPPRVQRAVLFATKSVLVCETSDDAMKVSYELLNKRQDSVALDGTYFQSSGIISGGTADLARKAKHWDAKQVVLMQGQKDKVLNDLQDIKKKLRAQSDVSVLKHEIDGYKTRISVMKKDHDQSLSKINVLDKVINELKTELEEHEPQILEIKKKIENWGRKLKSLEDKVNNIEDVIFADFCARIGVPNLRAYEQSGLRAYEERAKLRIEFDDRKNRILNQYEYEKTVDTESNIKRWNTEIEQRRNDLETAKQAEENSVRKIEKAKISLDQSKEILANKKKEVEALDQAMKALQAEIKEANEPVTLASKELLTLDSKLENLQRTRKSILIHCAVEDISIPILEGDLAALVPAQPESSAGDSSSTAASNSNDSQSTTSSIVIDFNHLCNYLKEIEGVANFKEQENTMKQNLQSLFVRVESFERLNMRVEDKLEQTSVKLRETNVEFSTLREKARKAKASFEKVKKLRRDSFMNCFNFVSEEIDGVYKKLSNSPSGAAMLSAENAEEPYLSGISYYCIVPGKRCQPMQDLSGGEKTIASLALLLTLCRYRSAPFLLLDEIDAALDRANIEKVAAYFRDMKDSCQTLAVSHRLDFFCNTDAMIGVTLDFKKEPRSQTFLFDLSKYPMQV